MNKEIENLKNKGNRLYTIHRNVKCTQCGHKGAVEYYGNYYPNGFGDKYVDAQIKEAEIAKFYYEKVRNTPFMDHAMGFGGTIPCECLNCGNTGLIDFGGLEGYDQAFVTIKEDE